VRGRRPAYAFAAAFSPVRLLLLALSLAALLAQGLPAAAAGQEEPPALSGLTLLGVRDGAKVYIDGAEVATLPHAGPIPVPPGRRQLRVVKLGFTPFEQEIQILAGRISTLEAEMLPIAGVLEVRSEPTGAAVYVDDQHVGQAPCELELKTGPHTIELRLEGYYPETFSLPVSAGLAESRTVRLIQLPSEVNPKRPVKLQVRHWYERFWVWPLIIGGTAALTAAIVVPAVYSTRNDCDRLGAEICFPIMTQATTSALQGTPLTTLQIRLGR